MAGAFDHLKNFGLTKKELAAQRVRESLVPIQPTEADLAQNPVELLDSYVGTQPELQRFFRHLQRLERVPSDIGEFHGWFRTLVLGWKESTKVRELSKTAERLNAVAALYTAWSAAQRSKVGMVRAQAELVDVMAIIERDKLTLALELKKIEAEAAETEMRIANARAEMARLAAEEAKWNAAAEAQNARRPDAATPEILFPVVIGRTNGPKGLETVRLPGGLRKSHMYLIGKPQVGKTHLIKQMVRQDMEHGFGVCFIDLHGDAVQELLAYVPQERASDLVYLDFTNREQVVQFNPLDVPDEQRQGFVSDFVSYLLSFFKVESQTVSRMENFLTRAFETLLASGEQHPVIHIHRLLTEERFRSRMINQVEHIPDLKAFWEIEYPVLKRDKADQPIFNKLGKLISSSGRLRAILEVSDNKINFKDILDGQRILLVRLSKEHGMEEPSEFLASLIATRIQQEAMSRGAIPKDDRKLFFLYLDEFQNYAVDSLKTIFTEAPKYGLWTRLANQSLQTIRLSIKPSVKASITPIFAFRIGADDAAEIQKEMRRVVDKQNPSTYRVGESYHTSQYFPMPEDFLNQAKRQAFVRFEIPNDVVQIETYDMPPSAVSDARQRELVEMSEQRFYRKREEGSPAAKPPQGQRPPEGKGKAGDFMQ